MVAVLAVAAVLSTGAAIAATRAPVRPSLAPVTPEALLASVIRAGGERHPVSGMLASHVALGLPSLPDEGQGQTTGGLAEILSYVNGDHRVRAWQSRDGVRIAELLPSAEISYTLNRREAWVWDSDQFTAYRFGPIPAGMNPLDTGPSAALSMLNLDSLARSILAAVAPTTAVSVGEPIRVAGRDAYALVLTPRTPDTLVGRIELDVDASTRIPLRAAVYARGAGDPALSIGYTRVSFAPIDPATYDFTPPTGAKVERVGAGRIGDRQRSGLRYGVSDVRTFGTAWSSVLAIRTSASSRSVASGGVDVASLLPISGPLFSVRMVERGDHAWLLIGAVPQSRLAAVGAGLS